MQTDASVYLGTSSADHIADLSRAVNNLINALDYRITEKDPPEHGSFFRRMRLRGDTARESLLLSRLAALESATDHVERDTSSEQRRRGQLG
jgi:hypothetical protein